MALRSNAACAIPADASIAELLSPARFGAAGTLARACIAPSAPQSGKCLRKEMKTGRSGRHVAPEPEQELPMQIIKIDPRALNQNQDDARQSKSSSQADALLLATVRAVGIIQPPVVSPQVDGGNGYIIQAGHRRVQAAIIAGLEEIEVLVTRRPTIMAPCVRWLKTSRESR